MLNINSLNNVRDQKTINKYQIYKKVLKKCHHRIKTYANKGNSNCFYIIPEYIYGIPRYDTLNCASYIVDKLKNNNFLVNYTYPNLIYINWGHIPSEIKQSKEFSLKKKKKELYIEKKNYRLIEDYKPSINFLDKIY